MKVLTKLRMCTISSEPSLFAYAIARVKLGNFGHQVNSDSDPVSSIS